MVDYILSFRLSIISQFNNIILNCLIIKLYILKIFDKDKILNFNDNISYFCSNVVHENVIFLIIKLILIV